MAPNTPASPPLDGFGAGQSKSAPSGTFKALYAVNSSNLAELKQLCKEEWARIPPQRRESLITTHHEGLIAVIAAEGGTTSY